MNQADNQTSVTASKQKRLYFSVFVNMMLTLAQVVGGLVSGSLSLISDALHNFSDAASLLIALLAVKIGQKKPDLSKTFGYQRAETIAALINFTTLILIGLYLVYEAIVRFISPQPISGWVVVVIAIVALVVDTITAILTYKFYKKSMNFTAAFLHNLTDALASVGVIVAGIFILLYDWLWVDTAVTITIAAYVLWQGLREIPKAIHLLMEGAPYHIDISDIITGVEQLEGVKEIHHVHVWQVNEQLNALEAHVVVEKNIDTESLKKEIKNLLTDSFQIKHSTLEFEKSTK
ncbi:cation diffusion facilitator family transporter [Legionella impletisoli]|uniref:Cation efflux system protein n=1 Tax=Legionella impletisoli TaxID=343510 RepID=A0A917K092_9GAMM|nr:cation diffusion facilitator family transporter [Legionella impletisoli]GGI90761.1 cation efflux system protein [Legionella impletisoli]